MKQTEIKRQEHDDQAGEGRVEPSVVKERRQILGHLLNSSQYPCPETVPVVGCAKRQPMIRTEQLESLQQDGNAWHDWCVWPKSRKSANEQFPIDLSTATIVIDSWVIAHSARRVVPGLPMAEKPFHPGRFP